MSAPLPFDPLKAAREELGGLSDIMRVLQNRERKCAEDILTAENELNAITKIASYVRITMDTIRARIAELEKSH